MDGIGWNDKVTDPVTSVKQLFEDPKLKGRVGVWNSMGDTLGLVMLENGDDPAKVTNASFNRAIARSRRPSTRADPQVLRQRLRAGSGERGPCGDHGVVRRHRQSRRPARPLAGPHARRDHLDRQHDHPARRERADGLDVHELHVRPDDLRAVGRRGELHLVGQGREASCREARPEGGVEQPDLPDRQTLSQMHQNDPAMLRNPDYNKKWLAVQGQ
jgi:hypothetical protein